MGPPHPVGLPALTKPLPFPLSFSNLVAPFRFPSPRPMMHPPTMPAAAAMYGNEEMHMYPPAAHSGEYIPRKPMPASKKAAQKVSLALLFPSPIPP